MRLALAIVFFGLFSMLATGCGGALVDRARTDADDEAELPATTVISTRPTLNPDSPFAGAGNVSSTTLNGRALSSDDLNTINATYGLKIGSGDFWYDPISGAWGYWGGPTVGFLAPNMKLGRAPLDASGGGTGVVLNGRELHPVDLGAFQQLLGYIYPGYYWLDANGYFGYEGGQALGNLIQVAQSSSSSSGGYYDSTYFGNVGSDGQSSYFYDSETGCSVMADGGLSC